MVKHEIPPVFSKTVDISTSPVIIKPGIGSIADFVRTKYPPSFSIFSLLFSATIA